jgi:hypothetical protein
MRPKKPIHVSIEQVRITRDGPTAVVEFADPAYGGVNLTIGEHVAEMSDQQVVDVLNDVLAAQAQFLREWDNTVTEIPLGKPQIKFSRDSGQWVPQGEVLRCLIEDNEHREAVIVIDDKQLSLEEFGRLLTVYAGWGMRIAFVPEELVHEQPKIKVRQPRRRR